MNQETFPVQNNTGIQCDHFEIKTDRDSTMTLCSSAEVIKELENSVNKRIFADSVLEKLKIPPIFGLHQSETAKIFAAVLPYASTSSLYDLFGAVELSPKSHTDPTAVHLLHKLIAICSTTERSKGVAGCIDSTVQNGNLQNESEGTVAVKIEPCEEENSVEDGCAVKDTLLICMSPYLLKEFESCIWNPYSNSLIQKLLSECSKQPLQPSNCNFTKALARNVLKWKRLTDLVYLDISSSFLVKLLSVLQAVEEESSRKIIVRLVEDGFTVDDRTVQNLCVPLEGLLSGRLEGNELLPPVFRNCAASRLLESVLCIAPVDCFDEIYGRCLKTHLASLATSRAAWQCVTAFLSRCSSLTQFEEAYEELGGKLEDVLASRNTKVLVHLAETCLRLDSKQGCFQEHMMQALRCLELRWNHIFFVALVLHLVSLEKMPYREQTTPHHHGVQLLSTMLRFRRTAIIVNSFFGLGSSDLKYVLCHQFGPDIVTRVMGSKHVQQADKDSFFKNIKGIVADLSCAQHGSQSLLATWQAACLSQRFTIMEQLLANEEAARGNRHAARVANVFRLAAFKASSEDWGRAQTWD